MAAVEGQRHQPIASTSAVPMDGHHHQQQYSESSSPAQSFNAGSRRTPSSSKLTKTSSTRVRGTLGTAGRPPHHRHALSAIRAFLRRESCFDILPESFRLIVFDNNLLIKRALVALQHNGVVSAPLYDSVNYRFMGMFTMVDVIHLIQYYYLSKTGYESASIEVESVDLSALREIEVAIDVPPPPIISVHPDDQLYTACAALVRTHARRLPLIDYDDQTGKETIVSVLTQYRVLKFIAINCREECSKLTESIGVLGIGTYLSSFSPTGEPLPRTQATPVASTSRRQRSRSFNPRAADPTVEQDDPPLGNDLDSRMQSGISDPSLPGPTQSTPPAKSYLDPGISNEPSRASTPATPSRSETNSPTTDRFHPIAVATLSTTVFDVVHLFSDLGISAVPIVNEETGQVINLYEAVDVVDLVRSNAYQVLDLTIEDALSRRSKDFPGVVTCTPEDSLASILAYIREKRVHRFVIVEGEDPVAGIGKDGFGTDRPRRVPGKLVGILCLSDILKYIVGASSLSGVKVVGLGRSEGQMPRVIDDEELDQINEGLSGLGIQ